MNHQFLLIIHLLCAAIWVGGHLFIAIRILPATLKKKEPGLLLNIEKNYEPFGMPALLLLVITGLWMAADYGVYPKNWFSFSNAVEKIVSIKLLLLTGTLLLALNARLRVIPALKKVMQNLLKWQFILLP